MVVLVLLLLRSETRSSGGLIGFSCVVIPFGDTQQWSADWLLLCCCYSVRIRAAVEC